MRLLRWRIHLPEDSYNIAFAINGLTDIVSVNTSGLDWWLIGGGGIDDIIPRIASAMGTHSNSAQMGAFILSVRDGASVDSVDRYRFQLNLQSNTYPIVFNGSLASTTFPLEALGFVPNAESGGIPQGTPDPVVGGFDFIIRAPNVYDGLWFPGLRASEDSRDRVRAVAGARSAMTGATRVVSFGNTAAERRLVWRLVPRDRALIEYASPVPPDGTGAETFERAWLESISKGGPFDLHEEGTGMSSFGGFDDAPVGTYTITSTEEPLDRDPQHPFRWMVALDTVRTS